MNLPPHRCASCGQLVTGTCQSCHQQRRQARDRTRPNSSARGYGSARWLKFRACQLALEPLCRLCDRAGHTTIATAVDHIVPVTGPDDPRFLRFDAVQSVCLACHSRKTAIEDSSFVRRRA